MLVSDATEMLVRDAVALRSLGEHRLRGLHGRMSVYQVVADGLPADFPVLRSVDDFPGNLPQQLTSLVGREPVVAEVAELVRTNPLVTLTGVGGVGKSRLALEVGAEVAAEFPDGVWLVELASVGDPDSVAAALATMLGITPQGDTPLVDTVAETLAGRQLLLAGRQLRAPPRRPWRSVLAVVLAPSRSVTILATSREILGLDGEAPFTVAPLAVDGGEASDAVALFVERARAVRPDFGVRDPETATAVTEICETLDGLPLGIELAAARMAAMSAIEVRDRLADRFRLLERTAHGPERQLTLRHTVEWSYDLLTDAEQDLLRSTSVFAGGFDLASVVAVVDHDDDVDVLRHLDSLVRKSLVVADHDRHAHPLPAVRDHPAVRRGPARRSRARSSATRDRHAGHFAQAAVARWEHWDGPGWRDAVDWVEVELGNLRAAYRWSAHRGDVAGGHRHRRPRRADGVLGPAVRDAGLGRAAARTRDRRRRASTPAALHRRGLRVLRRASRSRTRPRAPRHRARDGSPATTPASPATRRSSRRSARCTAATSIATSSSPAKSRAATAASAATASPPTSTACSRAVASTRRSRSPRSRSTVARTLGNPYWIAYALWIAGMAFSKADVRRAFAAWDEGVAFVREHRVQFFEGFLARDAARLHTSHGEAETALGAVRRGHHRVPTRRQRAAADHHARQRAVRCSNGSTARRRRRCCSARCRTSRRASTTSPSSAQLGDRVATDARGRRAPRELTADGAALDLDGAAVYARQQIEVARRDPKPRRARRAPGRPEPTRGRGAPARRRRQDRGRDRVAAVHLDADRRAPRRSTSTRRSACPAGPRRPAGPSPTTSSTAPSPPDARPHRRRQRGTRREMGRSTDAALGADPENAPLRRPTGRRDEIHRDPFRRGDTMILATTQVEDIDRFLDVFGTKGAEKRAEPRLQGRDRVPRPDRGEPRLGALRLGRGRLGRASCPTPRSSRSSRRPVTSTSPQAAAFLGTYRA